MTRLQREATKIAQQIIAKNFHPLYWEIKHSRNPKTAVSQALKDVSLYRLVDFIIKLTDAWYQQLRELQAAQDEWDVGE